MKRFKLVLISITFIFILVTPVSASMTGDLPEYALNQDVNIALNNDILKIPKNMGKPHIDSRTERTMVPVRVVSEILGYIVKYSDEDGGTVNIDNRYVYLKFNIGSDKVSITKDGKTTEVTLDAKTYAYGDRTYVPLRFLVESMGPGVEWDQDTFTVNIYTSKKGMSDNIEKTEKKTN